MRIVGQQSKLWKTVGIGATEIASLVGCAVEEDSKSFVLWAKKVQTREVCKLKKVKELEQSSPEWLKWREFGVGGSEIGSIMGANPWESIETTYKKKIKVLGEKSENVNMKRGKDLERFARELYENKMGWSSEPLCVVHDDYDFVRCSLDGIRNDDKVILEIKCPGSKNHEKFMFISEVEDNLVRQQMFANYFDYYRYQVLYQLLITNASVAHFVSYCPGDFGDHKKFVLIELYPEPDEQEKLLKRVIEFWDYVEKRECPPTEWLRPVCSIPSFVKDN